jgi:hypothetical protein
VKSAARRPPARSASKHLCGRYRTGYKLKPRASPAVPHLCLEKTNRTLLKTEVIMDNPGNTQPRRIHPLVATAAGAVIIASLAATAAITGLFPKASSNGAQTDQTQAAQVTSQPSQQVVDSAAPANPNTYAQQQQLQAAQGAQAQPQPATATDRCSGPTCSGSSGSLRCAGAVRTAATTGSIGPVRTATAAPAGLLR